MAKQEVADIRNVALLGPSHAGKTTLLEAMLNVAGSLPRRGKVTDGSSLVDYDPMEKEKKHSLFLKAFAAKYRKKSLNLFDTPGYPDFIGDALAALYGVETVALCLGAADGITFHAHKLWDEAGKAGRGRIIIVNRCDSENVDLDAIVSSIQEHFGANCVPATLPIDMGPGMSGTVSLLEEESDVPDSMKDQVQAARDQLIEAIVSLDDGMMEKYLDSGEVATSDLAPLVVRGIASGNLSPILFTAAEKDIGITQILDLIADRLPSPLQGPFFQATIGNEAGEETETIDPSVHTEFAARVFRTVSDPYVGRLTYARVVSGSVQGDGTYLNPRIGKAEKVANLSLPKGKEQEKTDSAGAGEIIVLAKAETIETNDTLCSEKAPVVFPRMAMPSSMVALAVTPSNRGDEQKLSTGLKKLTGEDPTFQVDRDSQTGELIVRGVSLLHVESQLRRLKDNFKVEVDTKVPRVPMRETVQKDSEGHHRHKKQSGGRGQFGEVYLRVKPAERGEGFTFKDGTFGGSIPKQFLPAIEKGIVALMQDGILAGFPVVDCEVEVYDGKFHDVDSDEHSFRIAGARAFRDAFGKANPILLEPVVDLEVAVPSRFMGDINSDLNGRRGRISGMNAIGAAQVIQAQIPLKEVQTYAADLRSITQGEGSYTFEFSHYDTVPHKVAEDLATAFKAGQTVEEE